MTSSNQLPQRTEDFVAANAGNAAHAATAPFLNAPAEASPAALKSAAVDVVAAIARCQKGAAFYEHDHPAAVYQRRELESAIVAMQALIGGDVTLAGAGDAIVATGFDDGARDDTAKALANDLLSKQVLALKLKVPLVRKDLDELVFALGESDKRVRAAGGLAKILAERNAKTIEVIEMDFDQIFATNQGDGPISAARAIDRTGLDPLVAKALTSVLALKSKSDKRGAAIELTLEKVSTPSSLGSLLDEIIDGAQPDVKFGAPTGAEKNAPAKVPTGSLAGVDAEGLAELCAQAFGKVTSSKSPQDLTEAANVLSSALVRLSPKARFKLLERIAHPSTDDAGVAAVGRAVPNAMVLSAVAQAVMGGQRDSQLAQSIANLLERMRPLERERQQLIDELDDSARASGRPLEGLFLQELNELSQKKSFGSLDLPFRASRDSLTQIAKLRQTTGGQPEIVLKTFASLRPENRFYRTARLLVGMLDHERAVTPATLSAVRTHLSTSAQDPVLSTAASALVLGLWNRALRDGPQSAAAEQLIEVMTSKVGPDCCIALLAQLKGRSGPDVGALLAELVRATLSIHHGETFRRRLVDVLHGIDRGALKFVERRVHEFAAPGVVVLVQRAAKDSPTAALAVVQMALRSNALDVKEAALRALAASPSEATFAFLKRASGAEGDEKAALALNAQKLNEVSLFKLERAAVDALGASRHAGAVTILVELLHRQKLVGGAAYDRMRTPAARALAVNATAEARSALDEGRRSKNRAVRVACGATA